MRHAAASRRTRNIDLTPAVKAAQPNLAADHEAEEQDERGVLGRQPPWVFIRRRNSSFSRSITFVVHSVFHWRLGNWKKVSTSVRWVGGRRVAAGPAQHFRSCSRPEELETTQAVAWAGT